MTDDFTPREPATLVIGPSWLGDVIMAQCLLRALWRRDPGKAIDVAAPDGVRPVLARMQEVRTAVPFPFRHGELALGQRLHLGQSLRGRYDDAFVLPGSWKSAIVPWAARVSRRIGYLGEWRRGLLTDIRPLSATLARRTAIAFQALADPGVLTDPSRLIEPRLDVDEDNRTDLLSRLGLSVGTFAALAPGAEFGPAKRWPSRHWISLSQQLVARGLQPVLLGSTGDGPVTAAIADGCPQALDLAGQTRLEDVVDLLSAARLAVTNDSGLMHVAAAVACPVVAIYGSTSPANTPPLSRRARTVWLELACSPCHARQCPLQHLQCLTELQPDRVLAAIDGMDIG